jgi:F-box/leucine-rich repeat protein 10/11
MRGSDLNEEWLEDDSTAMTEPVIIEEPDGLGMMMPPSTLTVPEIANILGHNTPLEVIGTPLSIVQNFHFNAGI